MVIHHGAMSVLKNVEAYMKLEKPFVDNPDVYLEAKLLRVQLESGVWAWSTSLSKCAQEAVQSCCQLLTENFDNICELMLSSVYWSDEMD